MPETPTPTTAFMPQPTPRGTKRVRIDQGPLRGSDIAPGRGQPPARLRAPGDGPSPAAARAEERRAEVRHDQVECRAWVGWKRWRRFPMSHALVINLSRGGAQVFLDAPPPPGTALWVFLETPGQTAIVKGRAVEVCLTAAGQCTVRVAFSKPCPFAFFEAAVCGLAGDPPEAARPRAPGGGVGSTGHGRPPGQLTSCPHDVHPAADDQVVAIRPVVRAA